MSDKLSATIVITTKNRRDDLRTALKSCVRQVGNPEILVIDDGSSDGTSEMVENEFPTVQVVRNRISTGYIAARNLAAEMASSDIVISIDDDAEFTSPNVVQQTLTEFDADCVGAVAIPYLDVHKENGEQQRTPDTSSVHIADRFIGTAHALRRDLFLELGGYRVVFFHQGEEGDYCLRLMDAGYIVRCGNSERIDHFESPKRDTPRMDTFGRRNDILSCWLNVPLRYLPLHLTGITVNGMRFGLSSGKLLRCLKGIAMGYLSIGRNLFSRSPVQSGTYKLIRTLRKHGPMHLDSKAVQAHLATVANRRNHEQPSV